MSSHGQAGFFGRLPVAAKLALATAPANLFVLALSLYVLDRAASEPFVGPLLIAATATCLIAASVFLAAGMLVGTPLAAVARRMEGLAAGDLETEVVSGRRGGEVGRLARGLESLRMAALDKRAADHAIEAQRAATEQQRQEGDSARAAASKLQAAMLRLIGAALARLADGDLTTRLRVDVPQDCRKLKDDFNLAMDRLEDAMSGIVATGRRVRTDAAEIFDAAGALAHRAEQQASGVEQVTAAVREIARSLSETASGVGQARSVVEEVTVDAGRSDRVVGQAMAAMGGIEKSSQEINKIIGVIDEIAFQTNLLALNAGVEAARAGEAGRGFVVVAQEVRTLAQRSAEAAKEIKALISASSGQVRNGAKLVAESGEAIGRITGKVGNIRGLVTDIARSANEQATGLRGINKALNAIGTATRENAAVAEQFTAASRSLSRQTRVLATLAGHLRDDAADPRPPQDSGRPAPSMPAIHGATALAIGEAMPQRSEDAWQGF